ncbi:MAG: hypothetical protein Q9204_008266, partial [Flavoplaca sp. TL-2023a]
HRGRFSPDLILVQICEYGSGMGDDKCIYPSARVYIRNSKKRIVKGGRDLHSFQRNKQSLIMDQIPRIPLTQLINPITTPDQYQGNRYRHKPAEDLEPFRQRRRSRRDTLPFSVPPDILARKTDEDGDDNDLEGETCDGDVDGGVAVAFGVGGEGTANGLHNKGYDVAGDEEPVIEFWWKTGVLGAEVNDAVLKDYSLSDRRPRSAKKTTE